MNFFKGVTCFFRIPLSQHLKSFHAVSNSFNIAPAAIEAPGPLVTTFRTNIRNRFPKPRESKRIKEHSWWARLQTTGGKKVLMRRRLKGRHCLAHGW